ncbi:MAG: ABC transporter ATP-binding protein [Chloroflexi bacterium]|nr:ABC transporter ATP-binding protein [Chloroflexota bacterium]
MGAESDVLLKVEDLRVTFGIEKTVITAVDGISFDVRRGQILGVVGESGSGKSVTGQSILRILPKSATIQHGSIRLFVDDPKPGDPIEITRLAPNSRQMERLRGGRIAMIFQEPMASFSPVHTIGNQIIEAILLHRRMSKAQARQAAISLLERVGIANPGRRVDQYAFELSGGMRQRAMIAIALAGQPDLLIADEPTTALDVTIQAQILTLLKTIQAETGMAIIFITHDLGVIAQLADEIVVMYLGKIVERGTKYEIFDHPKHPYTVNLLDAVVRHENRGQRLATIPGKIPSPYERPAGCAFHTRCTRKINGVCDQALPPTAHFSATHTADCVLYVDEANADA